MGIDGKLAYGMCYNRLKSMECFEDNVFLWNGGFRSSYKKSFTAIQCQPVSLSLCCCALLKPPTISKWFFTIFHYYLWRWLKMWKRKISSYKRKMFTQEHTEQEDIFSCTNNPFLFNQFNTKMTLPDFFIENLSKMGVDLSA